MASSPVDPGTLAAVRQEIESIDREIALLIAARLQSAQRALRLRSSHGRRVTDHEQEHRVLDRGRAWAEELGLPPRLLDELFRAMVEEGKSRFLLGLAPTAAPVVTVLVASPGAPSKDLGGDAPPELIPVPSRR